nr:MAG TPA: hypothetical protein [Caudoviricetes sp.]
MAKKNDKNKPEIIETEPVVIKEKDIITDKVPLEDAIEVEAPEVIIENSDGDIKTEEPNVKTLQKNFFKLKVNIGFEDKYTKASYEVGDIIEVEKDRFEELLNDERKLVSEL